MLWLEAAVLPVPPALSLYAAIAFGRRFRYNQPLRRSPCKPFKDADMFPVDQRLAQAVRHHEAGRLDEAEAIYRSILAEAPRQPHALHLLGVRLHQAGRHAEAIEWIRQALAAHGPHPAFHSNLAAAYLSAGLFVEAEGHCREALRLEPGRVDAYFNLAVALRGKGQLPEAASAFRAVLKMAPDHERARRHLESLPREIGHVDEALGQLRERVRLDPCSAQAHNDLGYLLIAAGQDRQALPYLQQAVRLKPDYVEAHGNLGVAHQRLQNIDQALACFREALRLDPGCTKSRNNLACVLEALGRIDEAVSEYRETLKHDPANSQALFGLCSMAGSGRVALRDEEMARIRELAERPDLPLADLCRLNYALAQQLDRAGVCDEAFAHCRRANDLRKEIDRRCGQVFDSAEHRRHIDRLIAFFDASFFARIRSFGSDSELPVFVVGMFRSGTSLTEQILASHPGVHGAGELTDVGALAGTMPQRLGAIEPYPECLARLDRTRTRAVGEEYLRRLRQLGGEAVRVVDKNPLNFLNLGLIAALWPKARVIHCRRDPVDTCLSCYFQNFGGPFPFVRDLEHLGHYYREYQRLMAHWAEVLPLPVFDLSYEELTTDQEAVSRRLVDFCGLEWDERCLRFHETQRPVWTASVLQVREPMYRRSVGRWKRYESHLQPFLAALNSEPGG
jgi:tetratricopeptide (TPR) repeat protein